MVIRPDLFLNLGAFFKQAKSKTHYMEDLRLTKLKGSLGTAIEKWLIHSRDAEDALWAGLDILISDFTVELMTNAAFTVLEAQSDVIEFYRREGLINEENK